MAFDANGLALAVDTYGGGNLRIHFYETDDDIQTVVGDNYFTSVERRGIRVGDSIIFRAAGELEAGEVTAVDASGNATIRVGTQDVIATGSYAARSHADRYADYPNVEDWRGYAGDSSDQGTIQAALTNAAGHLLFPRRTYIVEETLFPATQLHVHADRAVFDCSAAADNIVMFHAQGTTGSLYPVTGTPALHGSTIEVSAPNLTASGIAADDYIEIISEDVFDPNRTNTRIGEIKRVLSASGTTITLQGTLACPIQYSTTPQVRLISDPIVGFEWWGGVLIGRSTGTLPVQTGFKVSYGRDCHIHNVRTYRVMGHAFWLSHCVSSWVHNCSSQDSKDPGTGYGVLIGFSCLDCGAENFHAIRCRHAFTTGGSPSSDHGISYSCGVRGGHSIFSLGDSWDTHACSVDTFFESCVSYDSEAQGFNIECPTARVTNCASYRSVDNGFGFHNEATAMPAGYLINGIYSEEAGDHGLQINRAAVIAEDTGVDYVQANDVTVVRPGDLGLYILWESTTPEKAKNIKVSGYIEGGSNSAAHIQYATDVDLTGLTLRTTDATQHALYLSNVDRVIAPVHCIMADSSTADGLHLISATMCDISNASGFSPNGASSQPWILDNNCASCYWGDTPINLTAARWPGFSDLPSIGSGASHRGNLYGVVTGYNEGSIASLEAGAMTDVTVTGASPGDLVVAVSSSGTTDLVWSGTVTDADTVSVVAFNPTGGAIDAADGATIRVLVRKVTT